LSSTISIEDLDGSRLLVPGQFPLVVGGPESDLRLPGSHGTAAQLYLGIDDGALFVQPADTASETIICNGTPLETSRWLRDGDVIGVGRARIEFHDDGQNIRLLIVDPTKDNPTEPPEVKAVDDAARNIAHSTTVTPVEFSPAAADASRPRRFLPSPGLILEAVVIVAIAAAAWFVFTAKSVAIRTEPVEARVEIRGGLPAIRIGDRFLIRPGRYTLVAEHDGYRRLSERIVITNAADQRFSLELQPLPGRLSVSTGRLEGAQVFISGERIGETPLEDVELAPGEHTIQIRSPRYQDHVGIVVIDGSASHQLYQVLLEPAWAEISIRSQPVGATVIVDGTEFGQTPLLAEIPDGGHELTITLRGYSPVRRRLQVAAGQPQTLPVFELEPAEGNLVLSSDPTGATVTVDGQFQGQTPISLDLVPDSEHDIGLSKAGHASHVQRIRVAAGDSADLHVTLDPEYGELLITSRPANAEVSVDGEPQGRTGETLRLITLPHDIEVRKDGYEPFRTSITPDRDNTRSIQVTLQPLDRHRSLPSTINSPQGVELRLIQPGRFTMGASRREPGRRANETLREVELTRPFYMAIREVSNREYREFADQHRSGTAGGLSLETDHHPVVRISWEEAARYCNWLSERAGLPPVYVERSGILVARSPLPLGYRLPTEAEWAWAARGGSGSAPLKYAWGNALPVPAGTDNYGDQSAREVLGGALPEYLDDHRATAPVGSYDPNPRGLYNIGGNVSEWVHDIYSIYPTSTGDLAIDPTGPSEGEYHVIRGASWMDDSVTELRLSYRDYGEEPRPDVGFRIARSAAAAD
jgi:formylglycine-generating enzyme required for sulfatase activity